ncbi:hypothetical protein [Amycolatopsis sacchari]|uniref:hypothetical protein n=1 Tax=Amycolatopsis sacchari TaxID=115433 RepID=UPI003D70B786
MQNQFGGEAESVVMARDIGEVHFHEVRRGAALCQVPVVPAHYTDNERPLGELDEWFAAGGGPRVAIVRGAPGSGRTTLVNHWVGRHRHDYPDGRFFVRLASGPDGADRERAALRELLLATSHRPEEIPASLDGRAGWWRSWTTGKRVALVIDDASTASQVHSLLPGEGASAVLVTEAGRLTGLLASATATLVDVDPMADSAARELLGRLVGAERIAAEPEAVDRLLARCEGSTIALCVVGALLKEFPDRPIARLADKLAHDERVLRELSRDSSLSVAVVFDAAYERLGEQARRCYQALGAHPGTGEVSVDAVAAVLAEPADDVSDALQELVHARLVSTPEEDRYLMSGLVRRHARTKAVDSDRVLRGFVQHYLTRTVAAAALLMPDRVWHRALLPRVTASGTASSAEQWLDVEGQNVRAAVEAASRLGLLDEVCRFAVALWPYYERGGHTQDMVAVNELGLRAAEARGDDLCRAVLGFQLGFAHLQREDTDRAMAVLREAQDAARRAGSLEAEATAVESLALAHLARGDAEALGLLRHNVELAAATADPRRLALARLHLAKAVPPAEALPLLDQAAEGLRAEEYNLAKIDLWRGRKLREAGLLTEAAQALDRVGAGHRERGEALVEQAELALALGETERAAEKLREAEELFRRHGLTALARSVGDRPA